VKEGAGGGMSPHLSGVTMDWCHPGRQLIVSPYFFFKKTDVLFSDPSGKWKVMTFLAVVFSPLPSSHVAFPVFFLNSATKNFIRVSAPSMVSPGVVRP